MRRWLLIAIALALLDIGLLSALYFGVQGRYPELAELSRPDLGFKELSDFFSEAAHEKGALYAFELLGRAPLPPNIDVHLLGHAIGDILYDQQGAGGIAHCTPDFRNACSHTIVIGTLLEKGPGSLSAIADICRKAPGGKGAYAMCFHGLGHGVLAYNGYALPQAAEMCRTLRSYGGREYVECVGGMIMEMIAGVHDREVWEEQAKIYFKDSDPLYPCSAGFIDAEAKGMCYTYLTPHLFTAAGADLARPGPEHFERAFSYCEPLKGNSRAACFGGFGKEFVVLAQNRDIRSVEDASKESLSKVLSWCGLAKARDGKEYCIEQAVNSLYWGGENGPGGAERFCTLADVAGLGEGCFGAFFRAVSYYEGGSEYRAGVCARVPGSYRDECKTRLGIE